MSSEKRKLVIFTTDGVLAYQPTILNLYEVLSRDFNVTIWAYKYYKKNVPVSSNVKVVYFEIPTLYKKILFGVQRIVKQVKLLRSDSNIFRYFLAWHAARTINEMDAPDDLVAVDLLALSACQQHFKNVSFLSLEIYPDDPFKKRCRLDEVKAVITLSEERYEYEFGSLSLPKFIIPNAPTYKEYLRVPAKERKGFIWAGTIDYKFGVQYLLNYIRKYPQHTLTLKGAFAGGIEEKIKTEYADLILSKNVLINNEYMPNDAFIHYISGFQIGFCFYDWELIRSNINYYLGTAGRLYMYFSAGIPVIGCNTLGLKAINDNQAGIQIDDYEPETIDAAIHAIMRNYHNYAQGSIQAAKNNSFEENCLPLIEFFKKNDHPLTRLS